jgi:hypothetical protein
MKNVICTCLVYLCIVDQIVDQTIIAESSNKAGEIEMIEFPKQVVPCSLKEGDIFHFINIEGVVEIRCGEPEPS